MPDPHDFRLLPPAALDLLDGRAAAALRDVNVCVPGGPIGWADRQDADMVRSLIAEVRWLRVVRGTAINVLSGLRGVVGNADGLRRTLLEILPEAALPHERD